MEMTKQGFIFQYQFYYSKDMFINVLFSDILSYELFVDE
jgi:hypothetical protein